MENKTLYKLNYLFKCCLLEPTYYYSYIDCKDSKTKKEDIVYAYNHLNSTSYFAFEALFYSYETWYEFVFQVYSSLSVRGSIELASTFIQHRDWNV